MNRLYAVESTSTTTGFKADHRLALRAGEIASFAAALASAVGAGTQGAQPPSDAAKFLATLTADLKANSGKCVVIPGEQQSPAVHLAAIAINQALGNVGKTVVYTENREPHAVHPGTGHRHAGERYPRRQSRLADHSE